LNAGAGAFTAEAQRTQRAAEECRLNKEIKEIKRKLGIETFSAAISTVHYF
jgi:hypothetical protein